MPLSPFDAELELAEEKPNTDPPRLSVIKKGTKIYKSIIAQDAVVGENCTIGVGEYADSQYNKKVYCCDLVTVAEGSEIPDGVTIGKNVAIAGKTAIEDYPDGNLVSGGYIIKGGEEE